MKNRLPVLVFLLIFRCILGWATTLDFSPGREIRVTGYPDNMYQDISKCIIKIDRFLFLSEEICAKYQDTEIRATGTLDKPLIDSFVGNLWLTSAEIEIMESNQELKETRTQDRDCLNNFRESLVSVYKKYVPEPEAGLVSGVVLGYKKDIGQELYQQMIKSGSIHIAVASGYNILLVGGVVLSLSFWIAHRSIAVWIALATMILYALLAGGDPPVVRAVWMAGLMYLGQVLGRRTRFGWVLAFTAWIMLMIDPTLLVSVSFQLSVGASFGLMVVEPWMSKKLASVAGGGLINFVGSMGVMTTASTMLMTMPVIWWHFGRMSLIGMVSNILILPFVPPLMIFGAGMLLFPGLFSFPVYALSHWIVLMIRFFGS
jgi:ComEC/Rec2-related protein